MKWTVKFHEAFQAEFEEMAPEVQNDCWQKPGL